MVENHDCFLIVDSVQVHGSKDEEKDGSDNLDLSHWIKTGNEYIESADYKNATQGKVVDDECRDSVVVLFKPTITEQIETEGQNGHNCLKNSP